MTIHIIPLLVCAFGAVGYFLPAESKNAAARKELCRLAFWVGLLTLLLAINGPTFRI